MNNESWKGLARVKRRNIQYTIIAVCLVATLAACGGQASDQVKPYANNGYGMGNSNPNLNTSPTYYNYRSVMKLAKQVLSEVEEVEGSTIFVDGAAMHATLQLREGLTKQEQQRVKQEAREVLNYSFPVFDITIKFK